MLQTKTPGEVTEDNQALTAEKLDNDRATYQSSDLVSHLAGHVRGQWEIAKYDRSRVNSRMIDCLRRRKGEYSPKKLEAITASDGSDIFMMITGAKCRSAKSWLADLFAPSGDKPFTLEPTPIPDLPPNIKEQLVAEAMAVGQEQGLPTEVLVQAVIEHRDRIMDELKQDAEERAGRMETAIDDLLTEGGFRLALSEFLEDLVTYPAAIMKGLEFRRAKTLKWVTNDAGDFIPEPGHKIRPEVRRVSPFRCYPSPSVGSDIEDHWMIEHRTFNRTDLAAMRGAPGYNAEAIARVLHQHGNGGLREWLWTEQEQSLLEGRTNVFTSDQIDGIEYCGSLRGQTLLDWGMSEEEVDDPIDEYSVSVLVIGTHVIRALVNPDPAGKSDFFKACWQDIPGAFWGDALPEVLKDCQDVCNAAARSLVNNMAFASGPMGWVEMDRLEPGEDPDDIHPWRMFRSNSSENGGSGAGVGFFQPQSNASELMAIYERFNRYADDITGMPAYAHGSDAGAGAAKTASGLSMLLNAASKSIKDLVRGVDLGVIERLVEKCYNHLMLTSSDPTIKGDLIPKARGSESLVHKEQAQLRQQELLGITANELDLSIIGKKGRREMLSEVLKSGELPVDRILPSEEEMLEADARQAEAQQAMQAEAQQLEQGAAAGA